MKLQIIKVDSGEFEIVTTNEDYANKLRREGPDKWFREYGEDNWVLMLEYWKYEEAYQKWIREKT